MVKKIVLAVVFLLVVVIVLLTIPMVGGKFALGKKTKHIGGTGGSMYPTLSWCSDEGGPENCSEVANTQNRRVIPELIVAGKDFKPEHGMIVEVEKDGTKYGKRIVGLPGDTLLINDGYLYINGQKAEEPYLWKPGMTYGWDSFPQCKELVVPNGKMIVMGDNRPLSHDSRDFGFVDIASTMAYLPMDMQNDVKQLWGTSQTPQLMTKEEVANFVDEINKLRTDKGIAPIKVDNKFSEAASEVVKSRVQGLDFSPSPLKSTAVKVVDAVAKTGYRGEEKTIGELILYGAYDLETYKYMLSFNESLQKSLMRPALSKIGVGLYKGQATDETCSAGLTTIVVGLK